MKVFPYDLITKIVLPANIISMRVNIPTQMPEALIAIQTSEQEQQRGRAGF